MSKRIFKVFSYIIIIIIYIFPEKIKKLIEYILKKSKFFLETNQIEKKKILVKF